MPDRFTARLWNAQQGHQAVEAAWGYAKPLLLAEHRLVLEVRPENRSLDQNAHFRALCGEAHLREICFDICYRIQRTESVPYCRFARDLKAFTAKRFVVRPDNLLKVCAATEPPSGQVFHALRHQRFACLRKKITTAV